MYGITIRGYVQTSASHILNGNPQMRNKMKNSIYHSDKNNTIIELNNGYLCIIDSADIHKISEHKWSIFINKAGNVYVMTHIYFGNKRKTIFMHRFLMNVFDRKIQIDHMNHNTLDNRKCNLRTCTNTENSRNKSKSKNNKTGYKGVHLFKENGRYMASIGFNKKQIYLGMYDNPVDAAIAYNNAALKYHGEFALLNTIIKEAEE